MSNQKNCQKSAAKNRCQVIGARFSAIPIGSPRRFPFFFEPRCVEPGGGWRERARSPPPTTNAPEQRTARGARHTGERGSACSAATTTTTMTMTTTASATMTASAMGRVARAPLSGRHGWRPRPTRARGSSRRRARFAAVVLASRRGDAPAGGSGETRRLKIFSVNDGERRTAPRRGGETRRFVRNPSNPRVPARTARGGIPPRSMGRRVFLERESFPVSTPDLGPSRATRGRSVRTPAIQPRERDPPTAPTSDVRSKIQICSRARPPPGGWASVSPIASPRARTFDPIPVDPPAWRRHPGRSTRAPPDADLFPSPAPRVPLLSQSTSCTTSRRCVASYRTTSSPARSFCAR